ncbi:hypothetical protein HIM_00061 [Hirsutella minnesotensis 3608]|nr:hypothetical protein HIM_00061 [Hirsutella minnesotensis 3608]
MNAFSLLIAILAVALIALATPLKPRGFAGNSFSLAVTKKQHHRRDFLNEWAAAHRKWGSGVPHEAAHMFSLAQGGSLIEVQPLPHDEIYVADIEIGNPPQRIKMALDTGSSDVWVHSTDTKYRVNQRGPWAPPYDPSASTTAHPVDKAMWNIRYADESNAVGIVYRDTIRMGGIEVNDALVESAAMLSHSFELETGFSGIMGLAKQLDNNIQPPEPTFLSVLRRHLEAPVFAVDLRRNATSRFDFGHIDASVPLEKLTWIKSNPASPHWSIELDLTAWTGNKTAWLYHKFEAIIDTGTSLLFLPGELVDLYWKDVPGGHASLVHGSYRFPCAMTAKLPDLLMKLPGTQRVLRVPGSYLNYGPTQQDPSVCWGGLQSSGHLGGAIIGDVMLKALFVAFDMEEGRIGFANKILHDVGF